MLKRESEHEQEITNKKKNYDPVIEKETAIPEEQKNDTPPPPPEAAEPPINVYRHNLTQPLKKPGNQKRLDGVTVSFKDVHQ